MTFERRSSLLILDDDAGVVDYLCESLATRGFDPTGLTSPRAALARLKAESFDLVISDVEMPELRGFALLEAILAEQPSQLVLLMTAFGSIELALAAVRAGACDFIAKPFKIDALVFTIERALRDRELRREIVRLRSSLPVEAKGHIVAKSAAMRRAVEMAQRAARSDATVLLTGETGTGKSALARYIHDTSARRDRPFFQLNCAALPANLIESELFGVKRGAYTDARESRAGAFVSAGDGTLFLDEIGELPIDLQAKLLHALETRAVRPVGGDVELSIRARILAATNSPLETLLRSGQFRPDLYYRLNVIRIEVPPLRARREDIVPLTDLILGRTSHGRSVIGISASAMRRLMEYAWPGNVRELVNLLERAIAMTDHDTIVADDLDFPKSGTELDALLAHGAKDNLPLEEVERAYVRRIVEAHHGNKASAARVLGINRRTLYRKLGEDV